MHDSDKPSNPETIDVVAQPVNDSALWTPVMGDEALGLLNRIGLPEESRNRLREEALSILAQCRRPTDSAGHETGLVIGHIQSGKTMSFTAVAALGRDNGFQMVIVITGISKHLFEQTVRRLLDDLGLMTRQDRKWQHFSNPTISHHASIANTLQEWRDPSVPPSERQTIFITVLKHHTRLRKLIELLASLDLREVPALIIDDEADQAGLNTVVTEGRESTTYRRLLELRNCLPHHTLLQYTATPQAPLLINIIDRLSPKFAELLTPGPDYVGGRELFVDHQNLVRLIPANEIPTTDNQLGSPPESLLEAMRLFFLGVAAGLELDQGFGNRSMMVHPSQLIAGHQQYFHWATQIRERWQRTVGLSPEDPDRRELIEEFRSGYRDLNETVAGLPSFEALESRLLHAIRRTEIEIVNSSRTQAPAINWIRAYPFILVGGQALDRGFTVEGLTVTYMPRRLGVGHADTIQQRARFFGYKRAYLGYCRVFLEVGVRDAYGHYVNHEEDLRERLASHRASGAPLSEWKRAFFLNRALRPTRSNVLQIDYMQDAIVDDWYWPKAPHDSEDAAIFNRGIVSKFMDRLAFVDDEGDPRRTESQRHKVAANVPLRALYEDLLTQVRTTRPKDCQRFIGLLLQVGDYLEENPDATCTVYYMVGGNPRERSVNEADEIPTLFQGANPTKGEETYPGDSKIRARNGLTIQIHNLTVLKSERGPVLLTDVPAIAVWVPAEMARDWVTQPQGGS